MIKKIKNQNLEKLKSINNLKKTLNKALKTF